MAALRIKPNSQGGRAALLKFRPRQPTSIPPQEMTSQAHSCPDVLNPESPALVLSISAPAWACRVHGPQRQHLPRPPRRRAGEGLGPGQSAGMAL